MKTYLLSMVFVWTTLFANAQNIYVKSFGNSKDKPIIFLHGGPGYNCANFEETTAQLLADNGFFVIVYDRRGEGRSTNIKAQFTFKETFEDLNDIYKNHNLKKATLIGHSFGGIVATLFAEANSKKVDAIILVGAPVSLQDTFKNILSKSKSIYEAKNDKVNLNYISMLEKMDTTSIEYSSYCFSHAMNNGFYSPKNPTDEAKNIYSTFKTNEILKKNAFQMTIEAPQGFWKNEKYTTIDLTKSIKVLMNKKIKIVGFYGTEDGLYSAQQITDLQALLGLNNLHYFDNCSHNVFIDQQSKFIREIKTFLVN